MISGDELEYSGIKASAFNHSATLHLVMFLIEIYSLHVGQADLIFFFEMTCDSKSGLLHLQAHFNG